MGLLDSDLAPMLGGLLSSGWNRFRGVDPETGEADYWKRGGIAGLLGMPPWYEQSRTDIAMGFAGGVTPAVKGLIGALRAPTKGLRAFHGSPTKGLRELRPSERGPLGPAVYLSPADNVAQRYAGDSGKVYTVNVDDYFHGMGSRYLPSDVNPYDVWRQQGARVADAAPPEMRGEIGGLFEKLQPSDGYPLFWELSRLTGGQPKAQELLRRAGFKGFSGHVDGPEIAMFDPVQLPPEGIRAYHGSPHDFDKFDLCKIGTGEGAQAYGHGLYFAEAEPAARWYRDALSTPLQELKLRASPYLAMPPKEALSKLATAIRQSEFRGDRRSARDYREVSEWIESGRSDEFRPGRMYEVEINADPERFLDWDKPLTGQSGHVLSALERFGIAAPKKEMAAFDDALLAALTDTGPSALPKQPHDPTGGALYESSRIVPGTYRDPNAASLALKEAGIPGIKYLDQGSRAAGEGSRNYVVFDDSLISILRKYGLLGPMAGGATAGAVGDY